MASKKCYVWLRKLISLFENYGIAGWLSIKFLCVTLWHMSIRARVVVAVTFQEVDDAPDAETSAEGDNEGLKNGDSLIEESHIQN